jgi:seryl-tRNA synthetase
MKNKLFSIKAPILIIAFIASFGQSPKKVEAPANSAVEIVDEDLKALLEKSKERMAKANQIVKQIDKVSNDQVASMKEDIKTLQEVNQQLTAEIYEVKHATRVIDTLDSAPFNLEPISGSEN